MKEQERTIKKRRDAGVIRFGPRDVTGFAWLAEQGAMTMHQLAKLFAHLDKRTVSTDAARKTVARWGDRGWVVSRRLLHDSPNFVWLTAAGMRVAGSSFPHGEPALATLLHNRDVVDIRLELLRLDPHHIWRSEREIRALIAPRIKGKTAPHIPDGEVRLSDGRLVALERERTAKTVERVRKIQMGLLTRRLDFDQDPILASAELPPRYDLVCYYAHPNAISVVTQAREALPADLAARIEIVRFP